MIELTPEQRQAVQQERGLPVRLVDPATNDTYVLVRADVYERLGGPPPATGHLDQALPEISPGTLRSMQAFWRDLPNLLKNKRNRDHWAAYHGDECLGIAADQATLIREALRRGLSIDACHVALIRPRESPPWEPEEIEPIGPWHQAEPGDVM